MNILLIYADMYVYICAGAFTVYEYVYINTFVLVYIFMLLHVNRCIYMYSSMDICIQFWVLECIHSHKYTCVYLCACTCVYIHSSGPSVTALTSWRPLEAGPQVLSKLTVQ